MKLSILVLTTGEPITLETVARLHKFTPKPYNMTIWYDSCGRGVDIALLQKLYEYTDDFILLSRNRFSFGTASFMLYEDFDYLLVAYADNLVTEDYFQKMMCPFDEIENLATVGQSYFDHDGVFAVSDPNAYPDGIQMYSKRAINEIGALSPSFPGYGHILLEFHHRTLAKGWKYLVRKDLMYAEKDGHVTRDKIENVSEMIEKSSEVYLKAKELSFLAYDWWANKLPEEALHEH